uniref:YopX protein domain-containing protein n=1 Tax=Mammaliicoccus phage MSShimriz1 TaxID=3230127 RepID=A0AAU8GVU6_9VIRU
MIPKFRAYINMHKKIVDVQEINYKHKEIVWENGRYLEVDFFKDIELLQSTELFDKNGTEIFEGDIVTAMSEGIKGTGVVKRRIDGYWFMYPAWKNGQSWKLAVNEQGDTDVEIIGNKFKDSHLLGEE